MKLNFLQIKRFITISFAILLLSSSTSYCISKAQKEQKKQEIALSQAAIDIVKAHKQGLEPRPQDVQTYNENKLSFNPKTRAQIDTILSPKKVAPAIPSPQLKKPSTVKEVEAITEAEVDELQKDLEEAIEESTAEYTGTSKEFREARQKTQPTTKRRPKTRPVFVEPAVVEPPIPAKPAQEGQLLTFEQLIAPLKAGTKTNITKKEFDEVAKMFINSYSKEDQAGFYAIKNIIPAGSKVAIHADFHGIKNAMFEYIKNLVKNGFLDEKNPFKIKDKKNFHMVFLGDFVDRGPDGLEVLYAAMRLKIENPSNVELLKGNHEDTAINNSWGTVKEIEKKYNIDSFDEFNNLMDPIYNVLPYVLYLGTKDQDNVNYIILTHGGIEPRYNPHNLLSNNNLKISESTNRPYDIIWLNKDLQKEFDKIKDYTNPQSARAPGFNNNDFFVKENTKLETSRGNALAFGEIPTKQYLDSCNKNNYKVNAIIRGHQHNNDKETGPLLKLMIDNNGLYGLWEKSIPELKQWDGNQKELNIPQYSVWTLIVSPGLFKGKDNSHNFDTHVILKTDKEFKNWKLLPTKINM